MMNLTGDANGLDMITMPPEMRSQVPTANFFERQGYQCNPIAIRNNVVATLLAAGLSGLRPLHWALRPTRSMRIALLRTSSPSFGKYRRAVSRHCAE
jgi:hypothetical protein